MNGFQSSLRALFPSTVSVCYAPVEDHQGALFLTEAEIISRAIESRRREFSSGRWCSRRAMESLGLPAGEVLKGRSGEPLWPTGVRGSISHSSDWSISVAALSKDVAGLGVDVERLVDTPGFPDDMIFTGSERKWLSQKTAADRYQLQLIMFSAKESFYKAIFPYCNRFVDYLEIELALEQERGGFRVICRSSDLVALLRGFYLQGKYSVFANHVWSGITLSCR